MDVKGGLFDDEIFQKVCASVQKRAGSIRSQTGGIFQTTGTVFPDLTTQDLYRFRTLLTENGTYKKENDMEDAARYFTEGRWVPEETAHPVKIETQDHGVAVQVGCKTFAFSTVDEALKYVKMYLENPEETVKLFTEGKLFGKKKGK